LVPFKEEIVLQLDKTVCVGGHDGIEKKKENPAAMKSEWNVRILVQPSGFPYLNYVEIVKKKRARGSLNSLRASGGRIARPK